MTTAAEGRGVDHSAAPWRALSDFLRSAPTRFRRPVTTGAYRPEIDGLRFFAIAGVVLGHLFERLDRFFPQFDALLRSPPFVPFAGVDMRHGVYLFFAVSGFIIASQAAKARASTLSAPFLKAYFGRRVLRIEPPYMILLVATWAVVGLTGFVPDGTRQFDTPPASLTVSLISGLFYVHDLVWGSLPRLFPPGWTLEVEVQFYLIAPLVFWAWFKLVDTRAKIAVGALVFVVALALAASTPASAGPVSLTYSLLRHFDFFWIGIAIAGLRPAIERAMARAPGWAATALGLAGLAALLGWPNPSAGFTDWLTSRLALDCGILAVFTSVLAPVSSVRAFCTLPWISLIGGACYSLYLTHLQIIQVLTALAARRLPDASTPALIALMAVALIAVLIVGLLYYVAVERVFMAPHWHRDALARIFPKRTQTIG